MSDYTTRATVNLSVNGEAARETLDQLRKNALQLSEAIAKAAASGEKMELKKLRKELAETKKQITAIETSSMQVEGVLRSLDSATPKELNKTLTILNGQLNYIERNSGSWDEHVKKIQIVQREIDNVKKQIQTYSTVVASTLKNVNAASPRQLQTTLSILKNELKDMAVGSEVWDAQMQKINMVTAAIEKSAMAMEIDGQLMTKVLRDVNAASPKELNSVLAMLNKELQNMEVGSTAWNAQKAKIFEVKTALDKVKVSLETDNRLITKVMRDLNNASPRDLKNVLSMLNKELERTKVGSAAWEQMNNRIKKVTAALERAKSVMVIDGKEMQMVLRNLDTASPKQLENTLKALNLQMENLRRGSTAWTALSEKVKLVKAELAKVRGEMVVQQSLWERFNRKLNDWQMSIFGFIATFSGVIMAARSAVKGFAEMEEEMANTRKYTGLTEQAVRELNSAFMDIDTRTPRQKLNELAQEAGRLGYNTMEEVKQYVEASDIIRVALVDLGEGATQSIAKMTNIFGDARKLGIKQSMLSVGSAVNVLSQNCTASKPYLVNFTERMAGIGAQAKMTIPQILAFGAVLDANGQKVEMSASAMGKLIMNLFQKPREVAEQIKVDAEEFNRTIQKSTLDGVMMFLEAINKMGSKQGLAVLAPMFKDLGMDGVRMSQVLASLAAHLDEVKWQLGEADKAFTSASSATREYNIFNNTAQATLEKAKKRVHEMAVELGEKLMPVMAHIYRSSTLMLKVISAVVTFLIQHKSAIGNLTLAIVGYTAASNAAAIATKANAVAMALINGVTKAYVVLLATVRSAVALWSLALAKVQGNLVLVRYWQIQLNSAMSKNVIGAVAAAVLMLAGALYKAYQRSKQLSESERIRNEIEKRVNETTAEQITKVNLLSKKIHDNNLTNKERQKAINDLKQIIPEYNAMITEEGVIIKENTKAIRDYNNALRARARQTAMQEKLVELQTKILNKEYEIETQQEKVKNASSLHGDIGFTSPKQKAKMELARLLNEQEALKAEFESLAKKALLDVKVGDLKDNQVGGRFKPEPQEEVESEYVPLAPEDEKKKKKKEKKKKEPSQKERFKAENEWRTRQEALNRIAYAKGEKDYDDYTSTLLSIEAEYYQKLLARKDLSQTERLDMTASYNEAVKKQTDAAYKVSLEKEEEQYNSLMAIEKQRYMDGRVSLEVYENTIETLELEHLKRLVALAKEGTKERNEAEKAYNDKLFEDQKKKQEKFLKEQEKYQEKLNKVKDASFGKNPLDNAAAYKEEVALLEVVYQDELLIAADNAKEKLRIEEAYLKAKQLLARKYHQEELFDNRNSMEKMADDITEWLDTDGGKAIMGAAELLVSNMSSIFSGLTDIVQSEMEIQTAAIEKRYETQIAAAEGNTYKEKKLEKQKEQEIAKLKNEANKKMFAMQVMQAVASTALAAINAYSSAAQVPIIGYILGPIAAAMALASGAIQIAAIKKQQQASAASGYSEGGFTKQGQKNEVAGIVHAGEWVASQKLLANPEARNIINVLDYAQKTNTIGSLSQKDVSRSITAPMVLADNVSSATANVQPVIVQVPEKRNNENSLNDSIKKLNERLNEPFITVNTITGDVGIKHAQDEYSRLIGNKTRRSRR